jgi:adenylate cyclase
MIRLSIKRKIIGIAVILIVLMAVTAFLSMGLVMQVGERLDDLSQSYVPAYNALARANIHSLERAMLLRRMMIEKIETTPSGESFAVLRGRYDASGEAFARKCTPRAP